MTVRGGVATCVVAVQLCGVFAGAGVAAAQDGDRCGRWSASTVASGYQMLENLAFDGRGGLLLSELPFSGSGGALQLLRAEGSRSIAAAVNTPGGIVVSGATAYVTTGSDIVGGLTGRASASIRAVDLDTGAVTTVADRLTAPNGLARLPDGGFVVSRDIGEPSTLTRIAPDGARTVLAPELTSTNGLAYDPARRKLFVSTTFDATTTLAAVDVDRPASPPARIAIPGFGPLNAADDLTVGRDGHVYLTLNLAGRVLRVDPATGRSCVITDGLPFVTSVRFGAGPGWDAESLYATSFSGTITRLRP